MKASEMVHAVAVLAAIRDLGFDVEVSGEGTRMVPKTNSWKGLADGASWYFSTIEEALSYARGVHFGVSTTSHGVSWIQSDKETE